MAAPQAPRRGPYTRGGERSRVPSGPSRPPAHSHITRCRLAKDWRHRGMRTRSGPPWCQPEEGGGADRGKEASPFPPRLGDPLVADRAAPGAHGRAATLTARVYPRWCTRQEG